MAKAHGRFAELGCWFSGKVAEIAANPYAQIGVIVFCVGWFAIGWSDVRYQEGRAGLMRDAGSFFRGLKPGTTGSKGQ